VLRKILKSRIGVFAVAIALVIAISGAVFVVGAGISDLWTSPTITVTGPYIPPEQPVNLPLVVSSDFTVDRNAEKGVPSYVNVTLNNPSLFGAPGYTGVKVELNIYCTSGNITADSVVLEYLESSDSTWHVWPLTVAPTGPNRLTGLFGPPAGFPVGYGYNVTTPFRATFAVIGSYNVTAQAVQ
jgi:hypothetical protein